MQTNLSFYFTDKTGFLLRDQHETIFSCCFKDDLFPDYANFKINKPHSQNQDDPLALKLLTSVIVRAF